MILPYKDAEHITQLYQNIEHLIFLTKRNLLASHKPQPKEQGNAEIHLANQENDRNVTVDDLLSFSFTLSEAVDFMETGKTFYIPSEQPVYKQPVNFPVPLIQDMNLYFNIVTVVNFLTFCYQCYCINCLLQKM